jgi:hypothetical protein
MSGAVLSVGWGVVEKDAMELEIESTNCGSWVVRAGRIEVTLHDVRTLVLWEFTKHHNALIAVTNTTITTE